MPNCTVCFNLYKAFSLNTVGIIPARFASTRFPGKPLAMIQGKTMIQRVAEQALKSKFLSAVVVATDDQLIYDHVVSFGCRVVMTSPDHENGTSRCEEAVSILENEAITDKIDVVINIQGDEPFIDPGQIDLVAGILKKSTARIATLLKNITRAEDIFNPNVVKVVVDDKGKALYFSRQAIPFLRDFSQNEWFREIKYFKHIGIYGYKRKTLKELVCLKPGKLELAEKLEQLRWLEAGHEIYTEITLHEGIAIDTPGDLSKLTNKSC